MKRGGRELLELEGQGEMTVTQKPLTAPRSPTCSGTSVALVPSSHPTDEQERDSSCVRYCHSRRWVPRPVLSMTILYCNPMLLSPFPLVLPLWFKGGKNRILKHCFISPIYQNWQASLKIWPKQLKNGHRSQRHESEKASCLLMPPQKPQPDLCVHATVHQEKGTRRHSRPRLFKLFYPQDVFFLRNFTWPSSI